jgi:hypothetical protein
MVGEKKGDPSRPIPKAGPHEAGIQAKQLLKDALQEASGLTVVRPGKKGQPLPDSGTEA